MQYLYDEYLVNTIKYTIFILEFHTKVGDRDFMFFLSFVFFVFQSVIIIATEIETET